MAQKKAHEVDAWLARRQSDAGIVLLYGPDRGLVAERARAYALATGLPLDDPFCVVRLDAAEIDQLPGRLVEEAQTVPMFADRRLIWVRNGGAQKAMADDIRALIVKGEKVKVVEDKTGHDITRHILLQVIAEQEQFGRPILSTKVLEAIIRFYGNAMQGFLAGFLEKSIEVFLNQQEAIQSQLSKLVSSGPISTVADITRQNLETLAKAQESLLGAILPKREKDRDEDEKR